MTPKKTKAITKQGQTELIPLNQIERSILVLRGLKVMLDEHLAVLYGVEVKMLNRAVKRNLDRFPADFMFQLTAEEAKLLRFQSGTLDKDRKPGRGEHRKYLPYAFTEQGVAMLSSVLRSPSRTPTSPASSPRSRRSTTPQFKIVFDAIRELMTPPVHPKRRIGFGGGEAT